MRFSFQQKKTGGEKERLHNRLDILEERGLPEESVQAYRSAIGGDHISASQQFSELDSLSLLGEMHDLEYYQNEVAVEGTNNTPDHYFTDSKTAYEVIQITPKTDEQELITGYIRRFITSYSKSGFHTQVIATQSEEVAIQSEFDSDSVDWITEIDFVPHKILAQIGTRVTRKARKKGRELRGHHGINIAVVDVRYAYLHLGVTVRKVQRAFEAGFFPSLDAVLLLVNGFVDDEAKPALWPIINPSTDEITEKEFETVQPVNPMLKRGIYIPASKPLDDASPDFAKAGTKIIFGDVTITNPLQTEFMLTGFIGNEGFSDIEIKETSS
ncbi:hypothetical protein [Halobellus ordinarius]|uniref:hypothetical protein n=1 Tax=Halobellus ordinarius TaxID=3075120 RepID=UPI0028800AA1|nr:hypothetical protein [Halobellus sp. ZY16]